MPSLSQDPFEIEIFVRLAQSSGVMSYLEIGARDGGCFEKMVQALPKGSRNVALDLPGGAWGRKGTDKILIKTINELRDNGYNVDVVISDSHDPATVDTVRRLAPVDLIFVDGDHRYEAVLQDWQNYRGMARMIAFHDINGDGVVSKHGDYLVEVPKLWNVIKTQHPYVEIINPLDKFGIGVVWPSLVF